MTDEMRNEIVRQMGGFGKLRAMAGAKIFALENGILLKFKGSRKANNLQIVYNDSLDSYDLTFYKGINVVEHFSDVYCENLISIFETTTGLYLSL